MSGRHESPGGGGFGAILLDLFLADTRGLPTFERLYAAVRKIPIPALNDPHHAGADLVLILVRKRLFALFVLSAFCVAQRNASAYRFCSVTFCATHT